MVQEKFAILADENIHSAIVRQLIENDIEAKRVIDVLPEGTPDPEVLEFAHNNGYALLTHDEAIMKHVTNRINKGKDYAGVIIAPSHLQGEKGIGKIITALVQLDAEIKAGTKTVANNVYNQPIYIH